MAILERKRKRDGITVYLIDFRDQQGRRIREAAGTTKTQAKTKLERRIGEVRAGTYINPKQAKKDAKALRGPTFAEFSKQFLRDYGAQRRSDHYEQNVRPLVAYFGERRLREIRKSDLDLFKAQRSREVGPSTLRKNLTVASTMLKVAVRWDVLEASPAVDLEKPSEPQHKTRYLSREEWESLSAAAAPWLRPILTLAVNSGMRLKELVGVRWEDFDRAAGLLYIGADNKTGRPRSIPLNAASRRVLQEQTRHLRSPYVFVDAEGEPYISEQARNRITKATIAAMRAAAIAGASLHSLRHTAGSWAAQAGYTEIQIAKLLGHASTATTRRYTHLRTEDLREVVNALDTQVDKTKSAPTPQVETVAGNLASAVGSAHAPVAQEDRAAAF